MWCGHIFKVDLILHCIILSISRYTHKKGVLQIVLSSFLFVQFNAHTQLFAYDYEQNLFLICIHRKNCNFSFIIFILFVLKY